MATTPRIISRKELVVSPFCKFLEKEVLFVGDSSPKIYHAVHQSDYVGIIGRTDEGLFPIVRQYRPAVEQYTWEFPAGTIDENESPDAAARREMREETGSETETLVPLGRFHADTGRLTCDSYGFFAEIAEPSVAFVAEPGMLVRYIPFTELKQMMFSGEFLHQLHWGILAAAFLHGCLPDSI